MLSPSGRCSDQSGRCRFKSYEIWFLTHTLGSTVADMSIFLTNDLMPINNETLVGFESDWSIIFEKIWLIKATQFRRAIFPYWDASWSITSFWFNKWWWISWYRNFDLIPWKSNSYDSSDYLKNRQNYQNCRENHLKNLLSSVHPDWIFIKILIIFIKTLKNIIVILRASHGTRGTGHPFSVIYLPVSPQKILKSYKNLKTEFNRLINNKNDELK